MTAVPAVRIRPLNEAPVRGEGDHVLYWMVAARRTRSSLALQRAVELCRELGKPLLVLEALRVGYPFACDRFHAVLLKGMGENAERFRESGVACHPYVEREVGQGRGLLAALAARAAVVVTDDWPSFFVPRMQETAARKLRVRLEAVDGNGLSPLRATDRVFTTAHSFRAWYQKNVRSWLAEMPVRDPLADLEGLPRAKVPAEVRRRWPVASAALLRASPATLAKLPIDREVGALDLASGPSAARSRLRRFIAERLETYVERRNAPEEEATSGLSPDLHFGHISAHEVFLAVAAADGWDPSYLSPRTVGKRTGFWGMSEGAEAFLDQVLTWREVGFHTAAKLAGHERYGSLPDWALRTLCDHETDPRAHLYSVEEFEAAATHDPLWNAAQRQLRVEGRIHNYLRMLWGKKILEWSETPRDALATMLHLNDRFALDGRDPNSVSGIFWCLGRYDRAWGPERPIFGKVRFMSSKNTARKVPVRSYMRRYDGVDF